jgi:midasin
VNYYQQFAPLVTSHSSKLTAVIDKEFNDLVRIMRWNDGNYWALKASTEKSHRTLVKFMRKLKGALSEPVHPLLTAGALQTSDSDEESSVDNEQLKIPHTVDLESTDVNLTDTQQQLLHSVTLGTFAGSDPHSLTAAMAIRRMKEMVCEYSSSVIYQQWNTTVNDFSGEIIETVKQLQSLDFLDKLEGDKRKSAIKLNLNQKRKAIVELFKYLKKQGLSRHGELNFTIELKCEIFQLPVIEEQVAVEIPDQWTESIQKYFYHSIGRLASLQSAFVTPTKDLSPTQLKCCKGYASHLVQLICSQRKTLSSACSSIGILQHRLQQLKFLVGGELYTLQVAEYMHWQSTALAMVEVSLELVHDFKHVVETLPANVDTSTTAEAPPILSCGDRSIANRAITMLQDKVPDLQILFDQLMLKEKTHGDESVFFATRKDVQEVAGVCSQVESFCNQILDVLHLVLGRENHRVAMFEFLEIARSYLITTCQQCREWIASAASTNSGFSPRQKCCETQEILVGNEQKSGCNRKTRAIDSVSVLQNMVLAVQRVMQRHRKLAMHMQQNSEELLEVPCCLYLHTTSTEGINDMNPETVVGGVTSLLTTTVADVCEGSMEKLVPVVSLLDQYISLLRELVLRLALAHRTFCKLSSILLALFTDLVSKGVCAPPEAEEVEGEGGTDFEAAEGGGFDDGLGAKNVSNEVDAENLVRRSVSPPHSSLCGF